jgi:Domain of unknown function (DUF5660)
MDDTAFKQSAQPQKPKTPQNDSILESLRTLSGGIGKTVAKDVAGKVATDALASLFGAPPTQGEMRPNRPLNFQKEYQPMPAMRRPEVRRQPVVLQEDQQVLKQQIDAVRAELKALAASVKSLNSDIQRTIIEAPVDAGIYHKNFFERLRSILQLLREQIDDSRSWLSLFSARKQKRGYWGMYKKHGTSFGLSNERTLATQAG